MIALYHNLNNKTSKETRNKKKKNKSSLAMQLLTCSVWTSHMRTVPSYEPDATVCPSGEKRALLMMSLKPLRTNTRGVCTMNRVPVVRTMMKQKGEEEKEANSIQ